MYSRRQFITGAAAMAAYAALPAWGSEGFKRATSGSAAPFKRVSGGGNSLPFKTVTSKSLAQVIASLGLASNLRLCLDAGDAASYNPGYQTDKWLDTSGNGYDFYRGSGVGVDAGDPTFNGSAGVLSSNENWGFNGSNYFTYDGPNETWMNNLHKDSVKFSIFAVNYQVSTTTNYLFCTKNLSGAGFIFGAATGPYVTSHNGSTASTYGLGAASPALPVTVGSWNIIALSLDEAAAVYTGLVNGNTAQYTFSYTTPTTSDPVSSARICSMANTAAYAQSGTKLACLAIWEGTALTAQNLLDIYNGVRTRFGL